MIHGVNAADLQRTIRSPAACWLFHLKLDTGIVPMMFKTEKTDLAGRHIGDYRDE